MLNRKRAVLKKTASVNRVLMSFSPFNKNANEKRKERVIAHYVSFLARHHLHNVKQKKTGRFKILIKNLASVIKFICWLR